MMRILLCHNYYSQRGGEDQSFEDEAQLLGNYGHELELLTERSDAVSQAPPWQAGMQCVWNRQFAKKLTTTIQGYAPDVVHFTNTFPLISPAALRAASREGVAVVQALRNYRIVCPAATLFRQGSNCHKCLGKSIAWPAVLHGCYRGRAASAVLAGTNALHGIMGTWTRHVDRFFTLSEVARHHLAEGGIPSERLSIKPNFVPDPGLQLDAPREGAVFVGRLVPEKGVRLLLEAWRELRDGISLTLIGSGPLANEVTAASKTDSRIHYRGELSQNETFEAMRRAHAVIVPSLWAEPFGRVVIEAFALGTPVIASNRGALPELVAANRTGALFDPEEVGQLVQQVQSLCGVSSSASLREQCRREYLDRYAPPRHYERLIEIYQQAIEYRKSRDSRNPHPVSCNLLQSRRPS